MGAHEKAVFCEGSRPRTPPSQSCRFDNAVSEQKHPGHLGMWKGTLGQMLMVTCRELFAVGFCLKVIADGLMRPPVTNCIIKMLKIAYLFPGKAVPTMQ